MNISANFLSNIENFKEVVEINIEDIREYGGVNRKHTFYNNKTKINELIKDIEQFGIVTPLLVREDPDRIAKYECLAGHHRLIAAHEVGLIKVPCIVKEIKNDIEANQVMVSSNKQREELLPTEKAYMYRYEYEALKEINKQDGTGSTISELVDKYENDGVKTSASNIKRYIRLTHLNEEIQTLVNLRKIDFIPAVNISYLSSREQKYLVTIIQNKEIKINEIISVALKDFSKEKKWTNEY